MLDPTSLERALDLICTGRPRWERSVMKLVFQRRYPKKLAQQGLGRLPAAQLDELVRTSDVKPQVLERTHLARWLEQV